MMKSLICAGFLALAAAAVAPAATLEGKESYDLLFRQGTLDAVDRDAALFYERHVTNALKPETEERDSGRIELGFQGDSAELARLTLHQDEKHRSLGVFPASVGNPMIMFFYETVVRDMAEATGGSPFYVRNRVKDALIQPSQIETGEADIGGKTIPTTTITLRPFADDPNRDRMQGFGDLVLSVTMSDEVPGWYLSLVAETGEAGDPVYRSKVVYDGLGATE